MRNCARSYWAGTLGLLGEDPSKALLALLKDLPVACHGGWHRAREASFGSGWPGTAGDDLWTLSEEHPKDGAERLRGTALLDPRDPRWRVEVDGRRDLFAPIGVAEGLRLRSVDNMRFRMALDDYELPQTAPAGVDVAAWEEWRSAVRLESKPKHVSWFDYSLEGVYQLPELYGLRGPESTRAASVFAARCPLDARLARRLGEGVRTESRRRVVDVADHIAPEALAEHHAVALGRRHGGAAARGSLACSDFATSRPARAVRSPASPVARAVART